jgi:cellulose synthase/poly-beta-1,6-N-acetylglucosamine synthase-like glycosyltransferase
LKGDAKLENIKYSRIISCVINFYGRINLLEGILYSLASQDLPKEKFEVLLVEDRGGTKEGREIARRFGDVLNVRYFALSELDMGHSKSRPFPITNTFPSLMMICPPEGFSFNPHQYFKSSDADACPAKSQLWYSKG